MIVTGHSDYDGVQKNIEYLTKDFEENKTKIIVSLLGSCKMQVKSKLCSYISQSNASGVAAPPLVPGVAKYLQTSLANKSVICDIYQRQYKSKAVEEYQNRFCQTLSAGESLQTSVQRKTISSFPAVVLVRSPTPNFTTLLVERT